MLLFLLISCSPAESQTITGQFSGMAGEQLRLQGFDGFETLLIGEGSVDEEGYVELSYEPGYRGMAFLISSSESSFLLVLSGEQIELRGRSLAEPETIDIISGQQNRLFEQYAAEHPRREQALSAWVYLENIYRSDSLFAVHDEPMQAIIREKERIRMEDNASLAGLDPQSYISWYLPVRKRLSSVSTVAQYRTDEIPETVAFFRDLDYADPRLHSSGLLRDAIESHVWLIENSARSLDSVYVELNLSIDAMLQSLTGDSPVFNTVAGFLFDLLERRSLFISSHYLANTLLEHHPEMLSGSLTDKLEIYRAMKVGNTAPDIIFTGNTRHPQGLEAGRLSELEADYIVVVFAAGWCPHCRQMMPQLTASAPLWREQGVEVVMVSLDSSADEFAQFTSEAPFIATTDLKRWESPIARSYHVHAVPAMILLDQHLEILIHLNSVQHADAWIDWNLTQGNLR